MKQKDNTHTQYANLSPCATVVIIIIAGTVVLEGIPVEFGFAKELQLCFLYIIIFEFLNVTFLEFKMRNSSEIPLYVFLAFKYIYTLY